MKKALLYTTTSAIMLMAASAQAMDAKRAGQGFTDIMGDYTNATGNPALMTKYGQDDDFHISLGLGVHAADQGEAIDEAEAAQDLIEGFDNDLNTITEGNVDQLRGHLTKISAEPMFIREGVDLTIAVPNRFASTSLFVSQRGRLAVLGNYEDEAYLQGLIDDPAANYDADKVYDSTVSAAGYSIADAGISLGREISTDSIPFLSSLGLGTNLKYQRLDLATYTAGIEGFDEDEITDDAHSHESGFNMDLGAVMTFDQAEKWTASISARDLIENSVENGNGDVFTTDTRVTVGGGYQGDIFAFTAQSDLTEHGEMGDILQAVQYASVGAEVNLWDHAALRAGYRTDLNNVEEDVVTAGVGFSPFNVLSLDVAAFAGSESNVGAVVQVGFRF